jgi:hypothetical protein
MINMFASNVSTYGGCNIGLLTAIFEVNLRLFDTSARKKLLFVLRDLEPRMKSEDLEGILRSNIDGIWADINKPEKFKNH